MNARWQREQMLERQFRTRRWLYTPWHSELFRQESVGRRAFWVSVRLSFRSICMDLGVPMKGEILIESSTSNFLTARFGAGPRTKHIDSRHFGVQERVHDGDLSINKVLTAKNCADFGTKPVSASLLQHCKFAGLVHCWHGSHTPLQDDGTTVGRCPQQKEKH